MHSRCSGSIPRTEDAPESARVRGRPLSVSRSPADASRRSRSTWWFRRCCVPSRPLRAAGERTREARSPQLAVGVCLGARLRAGWPPGRRAAHSQQPPVAACGRRRAALAARPAPATAPCWRTADRSSAPNWPRKADGRARARSEKPTRWSATALRARRVEARRARRTGVADRRELRNLGIRGHGCADGQLRDRCPHRHGRARAWFGWLSSVVQDILIAPVWMGLVWAVHALIVMLEWCFTIDLLDSAAAGGARQRAAPDAGHVSPIRGWRSCWPLRPCSRSTTA